MGDVGYAAALVLAVVFAWAGAAKLAARRATERTFRAFGLPVPKALAVAVPLVELALGAGLVIAPAGAAVVALVVLAGFTALLVRAMRAGVEVGCGCFGTASHEPMSWVELVRNGFLAVAALVATAADTGLPSLPAVLGVGGATAVAAVVLALCDLRRRTGSAVALDLSGMK